jgi:hypothetical protein
MTFLKTYGDTTGPLGFPMKDAEARALDQLLASLPEVDYRKQVVEKAMTEINPGERADVSWISTESLDRDRDVVLAAGMDDSQFKSNPIVTIAHNYALPPVGKSLWRRKVRDGQLHGIKAKTIYPARPDDWQGGAWPPDNAFALVKSGLMVGKSIGFLTLEASPPMQEEIQARPEWSGARRIVRKWLLLEYALHWLPTNQDAIVEQVSKGEVSADFLKSLGITLPLASPPDAVSPFTTAEELARCIRQRVTALDIQEIIAKALEEKLQRLRGRI